MAIALQNQTHEIDWTPDKLQLLKNTFFKNATDDEFELFLHACKRTGLDPFMKQIHPVKRPSYNSKTRQYEETLSIQTGIDGYRLIAERTGRYAPGKAPTFRYDENGQMISSTAYVKKLTSDGTWHEISAEAFYNEYVSKTKEGKVVSMWQKPHIMLAKCAEALALRRAFPADLSGLYTHEEMQQAKPATKEVEIETADMMDLSELVVNMPNDLDTRKLEKYLQTILNHSTNTRTAEELIKYILGSNDHLQKFIEGYKVFLSK